MNSSRAAFLAAIVTLIAAVPTALPNVTIIVNGVTMTMAEIVALLKACLAAMTSVDNLRDQLREGLVADQSLREQVVAMSQELYPYSGSVLGRSSKLFASLGFTSKKRAEPSAETKAEAVEKLRATRAARGTKGKRQRAAIHGAPAPVPAAPATPSSPNVAPLSGSGNGTGSGK
jgi:hypothetical protein